MKIKVKPVLWNKPQKDGSHHVRVYIYKDKKKRYVSTGVFIGVQDWDDEEEIVKKSHPLSSRYNTYIRQICVKAESDLFAGIPIDQLFREEEDEKEKGKVGSVVEFFSDYIAEIEKGMHPIKVPTKRNYEYTKNKLIQYTKFKGQKDLTFNDITMAFYHSFSNYLADHHNCRLPGIGKHIKILKKFMNEALERGLHNNLEFQKSAFKVNRESLSSKIWLTENEIRQLETLDLKTQPWLERERDRWLISYYFLMRYSDSVAIKKDMVFQKGEHWFLRYSSVKTDTGITVPIKPAAWKLLQKYDFDLSGDTNQEANRKLKLIGALAGINFEAQEGDRKGPKYQFITTHTARRSAATQMFLQNVSLQLIAELGGWKKIETLKVYLKASGMDVAMVARDLDFFK